MYGNRHIERNENGNIDISEEGRRFIFGQPDMALV